jgi:uncharacterized zinc-type alcohol dehydrogenase-like protein
MALAFVVITVVDSEVEVIDAEGIDAAYDRVAAGDVRYRFVIDIKSMADG